MEKQSENLIALLVRIPLIPYTQSGVFGREVSEAALRPTLEAYPVSSPPLGCVIDSLQALPLVVERVDGAAQICSG